MRRIRDVRPVLRARTPVHANPIATALAALILALVLVVGTPRGAAGQDDQDGIRIGVTLGGISTYGLVVEFYNRDHGLDVTLGTFTFSDLQLSAVFKRYVGNQEFRPYLGAGLWWALARPEGERTGTALVLRAPVGLEWRFADEHAGGIAANLNRALFIRRSDPNDERPMNGGIVPLPGLYYRYQAR